MGVPSLSIRIVTRMEWLGQHVRVELPEPHVRLDPLVQRGQHVQPVPQHPPGVGPRLHLHNGRRNSFWLRRRDSNPRPSSYEPDELPLLYAAKRGWLRIEPIELRRRGHVLDSDPEGHT